MTEPTQIPAHSEAAGKKHQGCITVYLVLCMVGVGIAMVAYFLTGGLQRDAPHPWLPPVRVLLPIAMLVSSIALLNRKKWGFFGILASVILTSLLTLILASDRTLLLVGYLFILLLYLLLQYGGENKAWNQLD